MTQTTLNSITFGTSGFRGIRGESFKSEHVQAIALAIVDYLNENELDKHICIGADPREGHSFELDPASFTHDLCAIFTNNDVQVDFFNNPTPTPLISWYIDHKELSGGLILTASHNPAEYNGIKFNPSNGAPAPKSVTNFIEERANLHLSQLPTGLSIDFSKINYCNEDEAYADHLMNVCEDIFGDSFRLSDIKMGIDSKHGTSAAVWDIVLKQLDTASFHVYHAQPRSDFADLETNPTKLEGFDNLDQLLKQNEFNLFVANDPDADRHMIFDEAWQPVSPEEITLIIANYLCKNDDKPYSINSTLASSRIVKEFAALNDIPYNETAVGFKYFADHLQAARDVYQLALAVESSGGFSLSTHTMEKCGILPALLIAGIIQKTGQSLSELKDEVLNQLKPALFSEIEYQFEASNKDAIQSALSAISDAELSAHFSVAVSERNRLDGLKLNFESGDWLLIRFSGTEPLSRLYAESDSLSTNKDLLAKGQALLNSFIS